LSCPLSFVHMNKNSFCDLCKMTIFAWGNSSVLATGGTNHVVIRKNTFDGCKLARDTWGDAVIQMMPRREFDGVHRYHGYVEVSENRFLRSHAHPLLADNAAELVVWGVTVEESDPGLSFGKAVRCGTVRSDEALDRQPAAPRTDNTEKTDGCTRETTARRSVFSALLGRSGAAEQEKSVVFTICLQIFPYRLRRWFYLMCITKPCPLSSGETYSVW